MSTTTIHDKCASMKAGPCHNPTDGFGFCDDCFEKLAERVEPTMTPVVTPENIILSVTGAVYLVTDDTEVHVGHWIPTYSPITYHVAHVGPESKRISARNVENLKQLIADEFC